jgi:RimJ/RimL family protein N-acetyltransferase
MRRMEISVRRLLPPDAADYRSLMLEGYAQHPDAFTSSVEERAGLPLSWWEQRLGAGQAESCVFGGFVQGRLAGVAGVSFETRAKQRHKAMLFGMYVQAAHRGLGLGEALVKAVLQAARGQHGVRQVQLTVTQGNAAAEALYRRCGFEPWGVEPMAMAEGGRFLAKVHMACTLAP